MSFFDRIPAEYKEETEMQEVQIQNGSETHILRYKKGEEAQALQALIELVNEGKVNTDLFDAASTSNQQQEKIDQLES